MIDILVVDDLLGPRKVLQQKLSKSGYNVVEAGNEEEAVEHLKSKSFDLVLTDVRMNKRDSGLDVLRVAKEENQDTPVILMTAYGTVRQAVQAIHEGAEDYIEKPFELDELMIKIDKALQKGHLIRENRFLRKELHLDGQFSDIIGKSDKLQKVLDVVRKVSKTDAAVLIRGESGTGKDLIAQAIHNNSPRSEKPFVRAECAVYAEGLLESELFGHEKGAFTSADRSRTGRFEIADGGTLFLDEIGEIKPSTQLKLLRVLQEKSFERVGGTKHIKVDVRIIAATNKNLEEAIQKGAFREDLYYRINVVPIYIPPLRERKEDIPILVEHFIKKFASKVGNRVKSISDEAIDFLVSYNWRGNVRELENAIERAMVLTDGEVILPEHLPLPPGMGISQSEKMSLPKTGSLPEKTDEFERQLILEALEQNKWVRTKAAAALKIPRATLNYKMEKHNIEPPEDDE
ncbi:response regulator [Candidatus Poribacteria bacterium]|nr:response regulator [Candidatus Poribacteria bacterium]